MREDAAFHKTCRLNAQMITRVAMRMLRRCRHPAGAAVPLSKQTDNLSPSRNSEFVLIGGIGIAEPQTHPNSFEWELQSVLLLPRLRLIGNDLDFVHYTAK